MAAGAAIAVACLEGAWVLGFEAWMQPSPRTWVAMFVAFLVVWTVVVFAWRGAVAGGVRATAALAVGLVAIDVALDLWFGERAPPPVPTRFAVIGWQVAKVALVFVGSEAARRWSARGWARWVRRVMRGVSAAVVVAAAAMAVWIAASGSRDEATRADAALVLGANLLPDGRPGASLVGRVERAVALYQEGLVPMVIVTGGVAQRGRTEGEVARDLLVAAGVPAEAILVERRARNTDENFAFVASLLAGKPTRRVLLVTEPWHMPRAMYQGERYGLELLQAPASSATWRSPRTGSFALLSETLAYVFQVVRRRHQGVAVCPG
jgi:uncharacterized SAM-binding protein YcdF (DUF218 family)